MLKGIAPRLTELGKIKIGRKSDDIRTGSGGKQWQAPQKLDHFLVTTLQRDLKGNLVPDVGLMEKLAAAHASGDGKLREIPIAVLSDDIDKILLASYSLYVGKQIAARCDGETCTVFLDRKTKQPLPEPVVRACDGEHEADGWKTHGTLNCVITAGEARWGGVYKFRTTSVISIEQLYGGLVHVQQLTGGVLQGLPLRLVVRPMQVAPEGKATTIYVCHLELRGGDLSEIQRQAAQLAQFRVANAQQIRAAQTEYLRLLAAPESIEEQEEVAVEFHPGPDNAEPAPDTAAAVWEQAAEVAREAEVVPESAAVEPAPAVTPASVPPVQAAPVPAAPAPAPSSPAGSPLQVALAKVAEAKTIADMSAAFRAGSVLPKAEKAEFVKVYSAKYKDLSAAGKKAAHAS